MKFTIRKLLYATGLVAAAMWVASPPNAHIRYGDLIRGVHPGSYSHSVTNHGPMPLWIEYCDSTGDAKQYLTAWSYPESGAEVLCADYPVKKWQRIDFLQTIQLNESQADYIGTRVGATFYDLFGRKKIVWHPNPITADVASRPPPEY